ncbi:MAG: tyrosine-type recombinase/integrase [Myxococcota bacterium]|nr:tyrosine-type recombinase/integrase [Myxococcota bacterium]
MTQLPGELSTAWQGAEADEGQLAGGGLPEVLTREEVSRVVDACSVRSSTGLRNRALITILYRGGFRVSEALQLTEADLDHTGGLVRLSRRDRTRVVGLDPGSFRLIDDWVERRRKLGLSPEGPLFCTLRGAPVSTSYVRALLTRLGRRAGVRKRVSAEILRRTLAAELAREGFPVSVIQAQLGHANAATTSRYLAGLGPRDALDAAAEAMHRRSSWRP